MSTKRINLQSPYRVKREPHRAVQPYDAAYAVYWDNVLIGCKTTYSSALRLIEQHMRLCYRAHNNLPGVLGGKIS